METSKEQREIALLCYYDKGTFTLKNNHSSNLKGGNLIRIKGRKL